MKVRLVFAAAMLALWAGNALAGRACPSDVATGASTVCDKAPKAAHAAPSAHVGDAAIAAPAALPAHGVSNPGCCSMPFNSAGDLAPASSVTAANHTPAADPPAAAHAVKSTPAKPVTRQPQRSAVAPAFGPLFLAHQALML
jgi:hypothetical protein